MQNKIRGADDSIGLLKTTIENKYAVYARKNTREEVTTFCCCDWKTPKDLLLIDYPLRYLATGIAREDFPNGLHRGPLTACIELALDRPDGARWKLSDVRGLVSNLKRQDLETPFQDVSDGTVWFNANEAAIDELRPELHDYRVLCESARPFCGGESPQMCSNSV